MTWLHVPRMWEMGDCAGHTNSVVPAHDGKSAEWQSQGGYVGDGDPRYAVLHHLAVTSERGWWCLATSRYQRQDQY